MQRIELVDDIWGGTLDMGMQRLYEAISSARQVLNARRLGFDPFVLRRGEHSIALNIDVVSCDVDVFERVATACLSSEGSDQDVVENACFARELYLGDLDDVLGKDLSWVKARRKRLRSVFVDAMVIGSRSALRIGRTRLALSLAQSAFASDDLREDVMATLLECLCLTNRTNEASDIYLRYSAHVVSVTGAPPSRELRQMAASVVTSGSESSKQAHDISDDLHEDNPPASADAKTHNPNVQ